MLDPEDPRRSDYLHKGPDAVPLELSKADFWLGVKIGSARNCQNIWQDVPGRNAAPRGWHTWGWDIESTLAEIGVARYLGIEWTGGLGDTKVADLAFGIQVRSSERGPHLALHEWDSDDQPFVLVLGHAREQRAMGWMFGRDGKQQRYWRDMAAGRPCFALSPAQLRPMWALRAHVQTLLATNDDQPEPEEPQRAESDTFRHSIPF